MKLAIVRNAHDTEEVAASLPANWEVIGVFHPDPDEKPLVLIGGTDEAGWTLHGYVIPRLASGLLYATELVEKPIERPSGRS